MKSLLAPLLLISLPLVAGNVRIDLPGGSGGSDDNLTYYNGTPNWFTWAGVYRGTWFNTDDFLPGSTGFNMNHAQYWFYESANYPWDTNDFYSEVWNGDQTGPEVLLAQAVVTALHYAPCYHVIIPDLLTEQHFWCLINTEMSAGGWPSILGDWSMPGDAGHSFFSDDFIVWEPWGEMGEYYIVAAWWVSIDRTTWGAVKALF
ncbi:MAG: hypothetical protein R6V62_01110 [Candidatus Fermentibacteraceae bacterium]